MMPPFKIAIVGSGPAGLMAATEIVRSHPAKVEVHLFERRAGLGRKLLIAGSSGLNISHELTSEGFADHYEGWSHSYWANLFQNFGVKNWIEFIEKELGLETFLGTSNRYFVREMKASGLLKRWTAYLEERGVKIHASHELVDFKVSPQSFGGETGSSETTSNASSVDLTFSADSSKTVEFTIDKAIFCLGGASWETEEPSWAQLFRSKSLSVIPFEASNVGYEINWAQKFLEESEGEPLKKVELQTSRGKKLGELVVTKYGLEGTPIYFTGTPGTAYLDLKPDLTVDEIFKKLSQTKENLSPMRRVKHYLALSEASESLLFHHTSTDEKSDLKKLIQTLKKLPIDLVKPRPLSESISSKGGLALNEVNENLELKKYPGIFCGGEMLAWDAPTGGFLIQASISQGALIGKKICI